MKICYDSDDQRVVFKFYYLLFGKVLSIQMVNPDYI